MTVLLTRSDILSLLDPPAILDALRTGFAANLSDPEPTGIAANVADTEPTGIAANVADTEPTGIAANVSDTEPTGIAGNCSDTERLDVGAHLHYPEPLRVRTDLPGPGTATALLPGVIPGIPAYTVKVNAKFPAASPALRGIVCLHDLTDGALLALMDSATITAWRTGLAAALATDVLAPPGASTVGVIGAGAQAEVTIRGLTALRPVEQLVVHDLAPERAAEFLAGQGIPGVVAGTPQEVAKQAEIVVLATWSREPLLTAGDVRPGSHLTTLGADEPGKVELSADLLTAARVVVDDPGLVTQMGALGNVGLGLEAMHATLTDVLAGGFARSEQEITVYAPVGLPWQDLAIAWPVYQAAGKHRTIDFLG